MPVFEFGDVKPAPYPDGELVMFTHGSVKGSFALPRGVVFADLSDEQRQEEAYKATGIEKPVVKEPSLFERIKK